MPVYFRFVILLVNHVGHILDTFEHVIKIAEN